MRFLRSIVVVPWHFKFGYRIASVSCLSRSTSFQSDEHCKGQNAIQILAFGCCLNGYLARFSKRMYHSLIEYKTKPRIRHYVDSLHLLSVVRNFGWPMLRSQKSSIPQLRLEISPPASSSDASLSRTKRLKFLIRISEESRLGSDKLIDANMIIYR